MRMLVFLVTSFIGVLLAFVVNTAQITSSQGNTAVLAARSTQAPLNAQLINEIIREINEERVSRNVQRLRTTSELETASTIRAEEIARTNTYSHKRPNGTTFSNLLNKQVGGSCENLQLQSTDSVKEAVASWLGSEAHKRCLLNPALRDAGATVKLMPSLSIDNTQYYVFVFIGAER